MENTNGRDTDVVIESLGFYFQNIYEFVAFFILYGRHATAAGVKSVDWLSINADQRGPYLEEFDKAYQFFEHGQFLSAIIALKIALQYNPVGIAARFELCECYLGLHDIAAATRVLMGIAPFLLERANIAKFYRRTGFVFTEKGQYKTAAACYLFSTAFEQSLLVRDELTYILASAQKSGLGTRPLLESGDVVGILKSAGVPVISKFAHYKPGDTKISITEIW